MFDVVDADVDDVDVDDDDDDVDGADVDVDDADVFAVDGVDVLFEVGLLNVADISKLAVVGELALISPLTLFVFAFTVSAERVVESATPDNPAFPILLLEEEAVAKIRA